jgi:hypothetical protein
VSSLHAIPARAQVDFEFSPLVAWSGVGWNASCSGLLGYCEVASSFVSLRRASSPGAGWVVAFKAGTATAAARVEEIQVRAKCACDGVVLTVGESVKAVERPDLLTVTDASKADAVLNLLLAPGREEANLHYWSGSWAKESISLRGLTDALAWVDGQQNRTGGDRSAAAPSVDAPAIPTSLVADTDAFTDPERTSKELPAPVRALFARDRRQGCKPHASVPNRPYFDAHWVERNRVVFFVECRPSDLGPIYRAYTATGPSYADARPVPLVQWNEAALRTGQMPSARRDVLSIPMFMAAETLVLDHRRDGIKSCRIEHTYRWLKGSYRLLTVRASDCTKTAGEPLPQRKLRFQAPIGEL